MEPTIHSFLASLIKDCRRVRAQLGDVEMGEVDVHLMSSLFDAAASLYSVPSVEED